METDPALETCTESKAETGGEETREGPITRPSPLSPNRSTAAHTPTALTSTPPQLTSSCPPKLTPAPNPSTSTLTLTPTFTPFSSSTPTPNPPKLTPTPSSPPTLTCKTLPTLTSTVLNPTPTFTPTSPSLTPNSLTSKILTPRPSLPTLTPTLPTLKHSVSPSPTKLTHKPAPLPFTPPTLTPTAPLLTPSPSPPSPTVSVIPSLPPSVTHGKMSFAPGPSFFLTNGNARPPTMPTSPPITPFHTPASRQAPLPRPLGTPTLVQANQSISPVRPRVSQQALLLGRSPCSSRDQMLLRAQMLIFTSTLRPVSSSSSHPASAQPSSMATDRQTPPTRHLSVPPPTLYTSVRSVPLRPRLHSPNGHRVVPPRHSPAMRPFAAAAAHQALPSRQCTVPATSLSSQSPPTQSTPGQSQLNSGSRPLPLGSSCFDRLPPASRQLQMIALSAGSTSRFSSQTRPAANTHTPPSVQSKCLVLESPPPQLDAQPQRTSDHASPPPTSSIHKANSPLPYPHYQARHIQSKGEVDRQGVREARERVGGEEVKMGEIEEGQSDKERVAGERKVTGEEKGIVEKRAERVGEKEDQRDREKEDQRDRERVGEKGLLTRKEKGEAGGEEEWIERGKQYERLREMTGIEEERGERMKIEGEEQRERMEVEEEEPGQKDAMKGEKEVGTTIDQDTPIDPHPNADPATQNHIHFDALSHTPHNPTTSGSPIDLQRPSDCPIERPPDLPHKDQEDLCENMSTQSDNHSVLSSLSSQSPPASPCLTPPSDFPPPLLPVSPSHSETLSLSQSRSETLSLSEREPWTQRVWPEGGRRVLTHLVEGFVIHEGLQAFPVNRSSLLLGGQEGVSQNGNTEGAELLPLTDTPEPLEHFSESERVGVATDDPLTGTRERQRGVLQCESCGKRGHAHSFHRSKRYCSTSCARRLNVGMSKRLRALSAGSQPEGRRSAINKEESIPGKPLLLRLPREIWSAHRRDYEGEDGHAVPITTRLERRAARRARRASEPAMTPSNPTVTSTEPTPAQWSVAQVWDFIHTLPGCVEVAEAFRVQEIDGQALLLLTEDHLMTSMNIKLGPALKICAHINTLRHT
ncbi:histone-lysine N-methyltransferase, H3 lysine-79 specific-like isoform X3 [Salvelinus fontinalis]|uniref:histone-lysine N-methyltransferase, H3 lysine-79 specific-like isoform X3 n=1 Tax=Salvelinus fontinalis TaxID=8038 RepID=UPI002485D242|nr:histone-lysine N-methyltransferase, H3 lysine-79 specific-like isoform X3 [Salvelinus fontinalis]